MCKRHANDYDKTLPINYKPKQPRKGDLQILINIIFAQKLVEII